MRASLVTVLAVASWPSLLHAQDRPAEHYANGSVSLLSDVQVLAVPNASALAVGNTTVGVFGLGATARFVTQYIAIQPSLGIGVVSTSGFLGTTTTTLDGGLGIGAAFALTPSIAVTPMGLAAFQDDTSVGRAVAIFAGEVPFAFFLGRNGYIEPYVEIGTLGDPSSGRWYFLLGGGYRLGVVF